MPIFLLVAALAVHGWAYKILMVPFLGKSHVFSLAAIAEGLANRGHKVTFLIGENYPLKLPELSNRSEITMMRFNDTATDYEALAEDCSRSAIESGSNLRQMASIASIMKAAYVLFFTARRYTSAVCGMALGPSLSVSVSVISRCCIKTHSQIELGFFARRLSWTYLSCYKEIRVS